MIKWKRCFMGKPFRIQKDCYIYTEPSEDKVMVSIIKLLTKYKGLSGSNLIKKSEHTYCSVMVNVWKLIAKRIVYVKQFRRARIYYLRPKYKSVKYNQG